MKQVICLDKEDIKTSIIGNNFWINVTDELSISFTPDALDELLRDYESLKKLKSEESNAEKH